jgi:hypothetical protein
MVEVGGEDENTCTRYYTQVPQLQQIAVSLHDSY